MSRDENHPKKRAGPTSAAKDGFGPATLGYVAPGLLSSPPEAMLPLPQLIPGLSPWPSGCGPHKLEANRHNAEARMNLLLEDLGYGR